MKWSVCFLSILLLSLNSYAQSSNKEGARDRMDRIHSIKVAYITDRLKLSSEQSQQFWPVYNTYEKELIALRKSYFQKYKDADKHDDDVALNRFDDDLDFQGAKLDLKRKYKDQFLKILSPQQLADLFKAENEFNSSLLQRMKEHKEDHGGGWNNR